MTEPDDDRPDDGVDDEELAEMADELSDVLRELRDELKATREAREAGAVEQPPGSGGGTGGGGGGVPEIPFDLPSATDVLAFTDEKLIPAAITILEVNIRALELLQKGIRWARPDKAGENAQRVRSHAESVSRSTLQRLDTVLADLQDAASRGALPEDAAASDVIREARRLRDEIDAALEERAEARDEPPEDPLEGDDEDEGRSDPWGLDDQPEVDVDVESEIESIKAELGKDDDDAGPADTDDDLDEVEDPDEADDGGEPEDGEEPDEADSSGDDVDPDEGDDGDASEGGEAVNTGESLDDREAGDGGADVDDSEAGNAGESAEDDDSTDGDADEDPEDVS